MNIRARKTKTGILGFTATETMVTMAIIGILSSMLLPAVVNARRMTERRVTYLQYREYLMAVATSFSETTHLDQPLLVGLDFYSKSCEDCFLSPVETNGSNLGFFDCLFTICSQEGGGVFLVELFLIF